MITGSVEFVESRREKLLALKAKEEVEDEIILEKPKQKAKNNTKSAEKNPAKKNESAVVQP